MVERKVDVVRSWVSRLVVDEHYLPLLPLSYACKHLFTHRGGICRDVRCIKQRAVDVLVAESGDAEVVRTAVRVMLASGGLSNPVDIYLLSTGSTAVRKKMWKHAVKLAAELALMNFAYVLPRYTYELLWSTRKPMAVGATLQSLLLFDRIPFKLTEDEAEELVDLAFSIRQYAVEVVLEKRPKKVTDLIMYLKSYIDGELRKRSRIASTDVAKSIAYFSILIESSIVPYYLSHYGFIESNIRNILFFDIVSTYPSSPW